MNQAQWDQRVLSRSQLHQYFKCDEASGLLQDSSGNDLHMTVGAASAYQVAGPFLGALGVTVNDRFISPNTQPNNGHPRTMEGWVYLDTSPTSTIYCIGWGNIGIVIQATTNLIGLVAQGFFEDYGPEPLPLDGWHFLMATSTTDDPGATGMNVYLDEDLIWTKVTGWPIPNNEDGSLGIDANWNTISNGAFYGFGGATPDFPETPQVASMSHVIALAG